MRDITKLMIVKYKLLELKYDFMGYEFEKEKEYSGAKTKHGDPLIKEEYTRRMVRRR